MKTIFFAVLSLIIALPAYAQEKTAGVKELSDRLDAFEGALKDVQKKLSNNYVGKAKMKIESVDNIDALVMLLQEIEQRVQELTGESEQLRFDMESLNKTAETLRADMNLRFAAVEEKEKKLDERLSAIENAINKAKEEQEKAERARVAAEKKKKAEAAAKVKAEKQRKEKLKADFGDKKPKELYDEALAQLNKKEYKDAIAKFAAFLELHPKNDLAGNAQYWMGEGYYAQGLYEKAAVAFADGYKNHTNSPKAPDLLFKLGMTMARLKKKEEACVAFDSFEKTYPKMSEAMKKQITAETKKLSCK